MLLGDAIHQKMAVLTIEDAASCAHPHRIKNTHFNLVLSCFLFQANFMIWASFYSAGADVLRWLHINLWTGIKQSCILTVY